MISWVRLWNWGCEQRVNKRENALDDMHGVGAGHGGGMLYPTWTVTVRVAVTVASGEPAVTEKTLRMQTHAGRECEW